MSRWWFERPLTETLHHLVGEAWTASFLHATDYTVRSDPSGDLGVMFLRTDANWRDKAIRGQWTDRAS